MSAGGGSELEDEVPTPVSVLMLQFPRSASHLSFACLSCQYSRHSFGVNFNHIDGSTSRGLEFQDLTFVPVLLRIFDPNGSTG